MLILIFRDCLLVDPKEHPMLLAEPSFNSLQQREKWVGRWSPSYDFADVTTRCFYFSLAILLFSNFSSLPYYCFQALVLWQYCWKSSFFIKQFTYTPKHQKFVYLINWKTFLFWYTEFCFLVCMLEVTSVLHYIHICEFSSYVNL